MPTSPNTNRLLHVATLQMHACQLTRVLGEPLVLEHNGLYLTDWLFRTPDSLAWRIGSVSEQPVVSDKGYCLTHEPARWDVFAQHENSGLLNRLVNHLDAFGELASHSDIDWPARHQLTVTLRSDYAACSKSNSDSC